MTPERWKQVNALFHEALERAPDEREHFLGERTRGDIEMRREVESLLGADASSRGFLETPAWGVAPELMFEDEETTLTGRTLGPYNVLEEIGRGGMGIVYAAEDTRLGRKVALKALPPDYSMDPVRRERLRREARAAASLTHPSIATVFALEELEGGLYIVSELVRGRTLRDELQDGALAPGLLRSTLLDIADALAAAHTQGIVHRDLKPENIIRCSDGRVKVLDFGLARPIDDALRATTTRLTQAGTAAGTPGYMSPEQLSGGTVDPRADVFAFGVLAAEMATGEHPFGSDPAEMVRRMALLIGPEPVMRSGAWSAPDVQQIAQRCLRAAPEDRFASGTELAAALRAATGHSPEAVVEPSLWWWQFHQAAIAISLAAMPAIAWALRPWIGPPHGSRAFFAALVLATMSITARMNLLFTSRVHPRNLRRQRALIFPWVIAVDASLALLMIAAALALDDQDAVAGLVMTLSTIILLSLVFIEPATTRAAGLGRPRS
ncbi:MAG: serine/threonine protein kinase [Acidobacteriota bacterium]|nr:serine/threonine protein kinase [Acidobacteriota bacterium]